MKRVMIALFNAYLGAYDEPMCARFDDKADISEAYRRTVLVDPDAAFKNRAQEKTVCVVGEFDDTTGVITAYETPEKLCDLAKFFPAGYLAKKLAQEGDANA